MRFRRTTLLLALVTAASLTVAACANKSGGDASDSPPAARQGDDSAKAVYPTSVWSNVDATEAGFDQAALDGLAAEAEAAGSTCLVVTKAGEVVDERYFQGATPTTKRQAFSVTKSLTSTVVGIAQDDGALDIDDAASKYLTEWQGTPSESVTIADLLSNDSGREWSLPIDYQGLVAAPDMTAYALDLGQARPPGEVWAYNNSAIQALAPLIERATGERLDDFAQDRLLDKIGMADSEWDSDQAGNPMAFMGLQSTCLDLARFGYLALRDGDWDGQRVVSGDYLGEATGAPSTPINAAYGYLWWLNHQGTVGSPAAATEAGAATASVGDQMAPGVADNVYWALGFQEQIVAVLPDEGIVAVRMGDAPPENAPFSWKELTSGVLGAHTG